jgi:hypothetical protein
MLFTSAMPTHAEKNKGRRVLFPLKRANIAAFAFGLCGRAAGRAVGRRRLSAVPCCHPTAAKSASALHTAHCTRRRGLRVLSAYPPYYQPCYQSYYPPYVLLSLSVPAIRLLSAPCSALLLLCCYLCAAEHNEACHNNSAAQATATEDSTKRSASAVQAPFLPPDTVPADEGAGEGVGAGVVG